MSRQSRAQRRGAGGIMGPQSALTDFLASHNISANQIRLDAEARRRAAQNNPDGSGEQQDEEATATVTENATATATADTQYDPASTEQSGRGQRNAGAVSKTEKQKKEQKVIEKIKASKKFQKRKRQSGDSDDEDDIARAIFQERSAPLPGQMENCALCKKRFTVTPYSRNAPDGGLLCSRCGRDLDPDDGAPKKKAKRVNAGAGKRRQIQSKILDGDYHPGAKSLMTLCIETLAKNIHLAEDLNNLAPQVIDKIARKLSKQRLLNSTTLSLFLQPSAHDVFIYDAAKLTGDDFIRIFQVVPGLRKLKVCNAIHFKDDIMDYLLSRHINLEAFHLHGANLLSESKWREFLEKKGQSLQSLKVYWTDKHFGDEALSLLATACPNLNRLKVSHNQKVSGEGVMAIAKVKSLQHISLDLRLDVHPDIYVSLLIDIGAGLETFSLTRVPDTDNTVLDAIHNNCQSLQKLRITDSEIMTDEGFVRLFTNWENKPLLFIDFQKCRNLDQAEPRSNPDNIGLCSNGFKALMAHSGKKLVKLNVHACRHISAAAFEEAFSEDKVYPDLVKLEISFCEEVTDFIVGSIFRSCPNLRELNVFGCMKVKDVKVPQGKLLVGMPTAIGMVVDGDD
ncbi:RNI-like protein [Lasiosphaeris hirsuta]|uniref:RNI-like protein n=1 Tax=Lasiosphaeris hirsuta TaxID=260670 RepID=A0AA40AQC0_9PEZI|nr:RNI-like protein [Lasiosphaeris hirsuta]